MNKDTNKTKEQLIAELAELRKESKEQEDKLKATIQQLDAHNQQLLATEQQLRAANQQLEANNQQLNASEKQLRLTNRKYIESEARLKEAEVIAQMGNFTWEIDTGKVSWSDGLHLLLGYDKSVKINYEKVNADIHHPDDLERITAWLNECVASGKSHFPPNEYRLLRKNGTVIHVKTTIKLLYEKNKPYKIVGTVQDITEQKIAEEKLSESEEKFRIAFQKLPDAINLTKLDDGEIIDMNPSFTAITGYSLEEAMGKKTMELELWADPHDRDLIKEKLMKYGEFDNFEFVRKMKNGRKAYTLMSAATLTIKNEPHLLAIVRDIDELKNAEINLRKSETNFRSIFNHSVDAIGVATNGRHVMANPAYVRMFGYDSEEEIKGKLILDLIAPGNKKQIEEHIRLRSLNRAPEKYETKGLRKDGTPFDMLASVSSYALDNTEYTVVILRDITERNLAQQAFIEAKSNLEALLDNRKDSIWSLDRNYNYLVFNKPYADVVFQSLGVHIEKGMNAMDIHPAEIREFWKSKLDPVLKGEYVTFEFSHILEGSEHFFQVWMNPIVSDGEITGLSALSMDITERKMIEAELEKYREDLEKIVKERTKELEDKNNELERYNRLFEGREFRIKELRDQVKALEKKLQAGNH